MTPSTSIFRRPLLPFRLATMPARTAIAKVTMAASPTLSERRVEGTNPVTEQDQYEGEGEEEGEEEQVKHTGHAAVRISS